jgi:hypothetical protein
VLPSIPKGAIVEILIVERLIERFFEILVVIELLKDWL